MQPETIPTILAALMHLKRVDRTELGRRTGYARQTIHRWLTGERTPGVADLHAMLKALEADESTRLLCMEVAK